VTERGKKVERRIFTYTHGEITKGKGGKPKKIRQEKREVNQAESKKGRKWVCADARGMFQPALENEVSGVHKRGEVSGKKWKRLQ